MRIERVTPETLERVLPLIALYQRFYRVEPREERNREFFGRLVREEREGELFAALDGPRAVGFLTLYYVPSSLSARTQCILNDLFALPETRGQGVGRALLDRAIARARERGFPTIEGMTETSNATAQRLYDTYRANRSSWYLYSLALDLPDKA